MTYQYTNFYEMAKANALAKPGRIQFFEDDKKITNKMFLDAIDHVASYYQQAGLQEGQKVAIVAANSFEFVVNVFAITRAGGVVVPVNNFLKEDELSFIINDCEARFLVADVKFKKETKNLMSLSKVEKTLWIGDFDYLDENNIAFSDVLQAPLVAPSSFRQTSLDELAVIIYTSGTTGKPKGAMLSYKNLMSNLEAVCQSLYIKKKDRFIVYLPMFHTFTLTTSVLLPVFKNCSLVIIKSIMPFSNIIKQTLLKRVSIFIGVPDVYNALIRAKLPWYFMWFNSVRAFVSGASALSEDTLTRYKEKFKRAVMIEGYGLSETSPVVSFNLFDKQKAGSVGKPASCCEVKIVDEEMMEVATGEVGELIIKGENVMMGYLNHDDVNDETILNGWLRTGDLGKIDEEGFIYIVDRKKDLIISKGLNIYPREIEEELYKLAEVKAAAVIGVKDEHSGEVPVAYVELEEGVSSIDEAKVKKSLKKTLANFKIPKHVYTIDELPKNATGKVLKRVLKEQVSEEK